MKIFSIHVVLFLGFILFSCNPKEQDSKNETVALSKDTLTENLNEQAKKEPSTPASKAKNAADNHNKTEDKAQALFERSKEYLEGSASVTKDVNQAFSLCQQAAYEGNAEAQNQLAFFYQFGMGTSINKSKALEWYQKAAQNQNIAAMYKLGQIYEKDTTFAAYDIKRALKYYTEAVSYNDMKSQTALGLLYLRGKGVPINYKKGFELMEKASKQGYADAQFWLGLMYLDGEGTDKNIDQAKFWINAARIQGDKRAQTVWDQNNWQ